MNSSAREVLDSVPKPMVGGRMMALVTVTRAVGGGKTGWKETKEFSLVSPFPHP